MSDDSQLRRGEITWHEFDNNEALAEGLSNTIVGRLSSENSVREARSRTPLVAFSGGSTPKPLFQALAKCDFDWSEARVTLVDERWVDLQNDLSNERFIREIFLSKLQQQPEFLSLYVSAESARASLNILEQQFGSAFDLTADVSFSSVVLGMGGDGHTASFFPDAENVKELISYDSDTLFQTCVSHASQVQRITWSLAALLSTTYLVLHITGASKRALFEQASDGESASLEDLMELPIRSAIYQSRVPLHVYYCD